MNRRGNGGRAAKNDTALVEALNAVLADSYVLLMKTQACHWNAEGANFIGLHKLTEEQYTELFQAVDTLAERVRALGGHPPANLAGMISVAKLKEADVIGDTAEAARILAEDHATLSAHAKDVAETAEEKEDLATHDMLVGRVAAHDKAAWLLRSHLG